MAKLFARSSRAALESDTAGAQELLAQQPAREPDEERLWQQEYDRRVFQWAAEQVRDSFAENTWQAFWRTAVEGHSAAAVADGLGMTVGAVYTAKSRALDRIRKAIQELQSEEGLPCPE
jgi:DNA-directed RNA polymerase specialized sigma24 family protein